MANVRSQSAPIYGHRAASAGRGTFFCPFCKADTPYRYITVRRTIRLAGLNLVPLRRAAEYVECRNCNGTFIPEVLEPDARTWHLKPIQLQAALRVMLLMMLADGVMEDSEVQRISEVYALLGGDPLPTTAVRTQAEHARVDPRGIEEYLATTALQLNEPGKLTVIKGAFEVAAADGEFQSEERELMRRLVRVLEPSRDPFKALGISMPLA